MSSIFSATPGTVQILKSSSASPGAVSFKLKDGPVTSAPSPVIITSFGYSQNVNIQFIPTLKKVTYVYAFGDRMGSIKVSGIAFDKLCNSKSGVGVKAIIDYYNNNRAVNENRTVTVIVGGQTITGFLIGASLMTQQIETKLTGFSLDIAALPQGS